MTNNLPFKTRIDPLDGFYQNIELLLNEYRKEPETSIPEQLDHLLMRDLTKSARAFLDTGFVGRLAVLFPKSWGITQEVRYTALSRVNNLDAKYSMYLNEEMYIDKESPAYYGEEMECYASGEVPEAIYILQSDEEVFYREDSYLFFCNLPYDAHANNKSEDGDYDTTQLGEFYDLRTKVGVFHPDKTLAIVHPATSIDLIIIDKLLRLPLGHQWLYGSWARGLGRKPNSDGKTYVSDIGIRDGGFASLDRTEGRSSDENGLLLALTKR